MLRLDGNKKILCVIVENSNGSTTRPRALTDGWKKKQPWLRQSEYASSFCLAFVDDAGGLNLFPRYRHFFSRTAP